MFVGGAKKLAVCMQIGSGSRLHIYFRGFNLLDLPVPVDYWGVVSQLCLKWD